MDGWKRDDLRFYHSDLTRLTMAGWEPAKEKREA